MMVRAGPRGVMRVVLVIVPLLLAPTAAATGTCELFGYVCADAGALTWGDQSTDCEDVGDYRGIMLYGGAYVSNWGVFVGAYDSCFTTDNGAYHHVAGTFFGADASTIGVYGEWASAERVNEPEGDLHACETRLGAAAAGFGPYWQSAGCPAGDPPTGLVFDTLP